MFHTFIISWLRERQMEQAKLQDFIHRLCDDLEIDPKPTINENREYNLSIFDNINLYIIELDDHAFIRCNLYEMPKEKKEDLLTFLMGANFIGQETGGSAIGLDEEEKNLTLSLLMPYELNYILFKEKLEDFINYVYYIRDEIVQFSSANKSLF